jgi:hypothetical protein
VKPSEIRTELLRQHESIRALLAATRACAKQSRAGLPAAADLKAVLLELYNEVCAHNFNEEALLRDVLWRADVWGPARAAFMTAEHLEEHTRLRTALHAVPTAPPELAGQGVVALVDWIGDHMDREEVAFLGADVLCDDVIVSDQSDG